MILRKVVVLLLACLAAGAVLSFSSPAMASIPARPGTIAATIALPDSTACTLDGEVCVAVIGDWLFVREPWRSTQLLAVYANLPAGAIRPWDSVLVRGTKTTLSGQPIVIATSIELYLDSRGRVFPFWCKDARRAWSWEYMRPVALGPVASPPPAVPDPTPPPVYSPPMVGEPGTVAGAKLSTNDIELIRGIQAAMFEEGEIDLTDTPVTAVFCTPRTNKIEFFYVEETSRAGGIKVVPQIPVWVLPGDTVSVEGTVVSGTTTGECYIDATSVVKTGTDDIPKPLGIPQRSTAGGAFGAQPALYLNPGGSAGGLNLVGSRVRVWGDWVVTDEDEANDHTAHFLNDGSGAARSNQSGLKVLYYRSGDEPTVPTNGMVTATGILGAEIDDGHPVPVVRVPRQPTQRVVYVKLDGDDENSGLTWDLAKKTLHEAVDTADDFTPPYEVWVAAGDYGCGGQAIEVFYDDAVQLYGGFVGTETERERRNWRLNETVIRDDITITGNPLLTSAYPAVIDGFTIRSNIVCNCSSLEADVSIRHNTIWGYVDLTGSADAEIRIENNWFREDGPYSGGLDVGTGSSPVLISNNTVTDFATNPGIRLSDSTPTIANNIFAHNAIAIQRNSGTGVPSIINNCFYQNGDNYDPDGIAPSPDPTNIYQNPLLVGDTNPHTSYTDIHILFNSPCLNVGNSSTSIVPVGSLDIDGRPRIAGGTADIGADEFGDGGAETMQFPSLVMAGSSTSTTVTAHVCDEAAGSGVEGRRVEFVLSGGQITAINGVSASGTSGYGITDANGDVPLTLTTPSTAQRITVAATTSLGRGRVTQVCVILPHVYKVGFVAELASDGRNERSYIHDYLGRIDAKYSEITYEMIDEDDLTSVGLSSFNTVIIAVPLHSLLPEQITALSDFAQYSGREKRVVLVGEYNNDYTDEHARLNAIAAGIGMHIEFRTNGNAYDAGFDPWRLCPMNSSHYLMSGVAYMWDSFTDRFVNTGDHDWNLWARPLAYVSYLWEEWSQQEPWIVEEDPLDEGSRIAIHDTSMFDGYDDRYDTVPDKNFRFVYNLCTVFPID